MPVCPWASPVQSTPRPDNSAQLLTQWRYGSWTAVRRQIGFIGSIGAYYSLWVYLTQSNGYTKALRLLLNCKQILVCVCSWREMICWALKADLPLSLTKKEK